MGTEARKTAIDIIGDVWWGTHFCQFYQTKEDLIDILVPYFKAGLENNEFCMWVTSEPLQVKNAKTALKKAVKDLDEYLGKGQIEILDYSQWYVKSGRFDSKKVLQGWVDKERKAIEDGFDGLRLTGNTFWLARKDWKDFAEYEASVNAVIGEHRMLAVCTYCLDRCSASDIIDVVSNHQFALIKREGKWEIIESGHYREVMQALRESEEKFRNLAEQSPNMIFINQAGRIVYANERCEQVTGYEKEQLYSADFDYLSLIAEEHHQAIRANFSRHMQGQEVPPFEYAIVTREGTRVEAILTTKLIRYDGQPAILGIVTDITERKKVEEELKTETEFTEMALNAQTDTLFVFEPSTGKAIRWNQAFNRVSGYSDEEIRSMKAPDSYYSEQDLAKAAAATRKILKEGVASVELALVTNDGRAIPTEYTGSLIRDDRGDRKYIIAIGRDVTERKQVQEQMWSLAKFPAEDPNPVLRISKDGTIVYANDPSSPVLETWQRRVGQRLPDACRERVKEALSSGKVRTFEFECNNGRVFFVTLAPSADGEYANAYGVDITQRKRAQDEQAESELRFRQLAENISEVFWLYDLDSDEFIYVSPAYETIFGTSRQGLYENPRRWVDAVHTDDRARIMRDFQKERRGIPFEDEYRIVRPDGGLRWIKDRGFAISDETGRVFRIAGIAEDITERKQAESALYDSEERFRTLFEHAGDALFLIDPESGRFIDVNQQACDALGYTRRELLALGVADVDPIYPKDKFAEFVGTLKTGQPVTIEAVHQRKDGTTFPVEIRTGLIEVQGKARLLSVVRNVAERKQAEEALRLHEARLQALLDLNKMVESSQQEILDFVREEIIKVTQSRFAFIGFLNDDGSELTMDNWSKETMAQCAVEKKPLHFAVSEAGLWADAIRLRKPMIVNPRP
ncbi:MAG: PAS domain S-box protein [Planctomycetota bacterium]|jgi:PAS domain S-box-containing protein